MLARVDANVILGPSLDLKTLADSLAKIKEAFNKQQPFTVDVANVSSVDTAGVQLLLVVGRALVSRGEGYGIRGGSAILERAFTELGVDKSECRGARHG